jgi:hypothetical protein
MLDELNSDINKKILRREERANDQWAEVHFSFPSDDGILEKSAIILKRTMYSGLLVVLGV